jgi:DNA-directed RNA polymerase specialized sigma24 family protein
VTRGAGPGGRSAEDSLLSGLYQQVTEQQAALLAAGYDLTAGLARYRAWLSEHADGRESAADRGVQVLYAGHYRSMVRLSALLTRDPAVAEEVVQEAFVAVHDAWDELGETSRALTFVRRCVVLGSRSRPSAGVIAEPAAGSAPARPAAGQIRALARHDLALLAVLRTLPAPQREALVLRYYADLPETELAPVMGMSHRAARGHLNRALAVLRTSLPETG